MDVTFTNARWTRLAVLLLLCLVLLQVSAAELTLTVSGPETQPTAGQRTSFWVVALNPSTQNISWTAPDEIHCELQAQQTLIPITARPAPTQPGGVIDLAPGTFARQEYVFQIPESVVGDATIAFTNLVSVNLKLSIQKSKLDELAAQKHGLLYFFMGRKQAAHAGDYDPDTFFKQHIFGYQPFYFLAGTKSPNAKFQISFKYRLLNEDGWLAEQAPWLTGLHVAYSQTSLWDWNGESAPFYDSSYRPEILYAWDDVFGSQPTNWFRLDLQGGVQHESNGKDGNDSRSLNIVYLSPTLTVGKDSGLQLKLTPRAWVYVGDMSDNPDMPDYRGYVDVRGVLGWKRGLQLSALGRMGNHYNRASGQFDLTYPLMQPPSGSFSIYLQVQYFLGYGESLLGYDQRTDILRVGFSLYR